MASSNITLSLSPSFADSHVNGSLNWHPFIGFGAIVAICAPSFLGNLLVFCSILHSKELRISPTYMAMAVLAVIDIMECFLDVGAFGGMILVGHHLPSSDTRLYLVNIIYPLWYGTCIAYATIAINRWLTICHPNLNAKIFSKRNMLIWISLWPGLVATMMAPILSGRCCLLDFVPSRWLLQFYTQNEYNYQLDVCWSVSATVSGISLIVYPMAFLKIRKMKAKISNNANNTHAASAGDIKLVLQFSLLMVVYTFTWVVLHYEESLGPEKSDAFIGYLGVLGYAMMTLTNPVVYFGLNKTMRSAAKKYLLSVKETSKYIGLGHSSTSNTN